MAERLAPVHEPTEETTGGERKRERSGVEFPYNDLDTALEVAKTIHQRGGLQLARDQLASFMRHESAFTSTFRIKIASARMFGLVDVGREFIILTPLGRRAADPQLEREVRVDAFLQVPLFKKVYEKYRGNVLPPDIGLEQELVGIGVAVKQKDRARQILQRSAEQAGFFTQGRNRLVPPVLGSPADEATPPPYDSARADFTSPLPTIPAAPTGPRHSQAGGGGGSSYDSTSPMGNKLIQGLVESLPPIGTEWAEVERQEWAALAELIFKRVYKDTIRGGAAVESSRDRTWQTEGHR